MAKKKLAWLVVVTGLVLVQQPGIAEELKLVSPAQVGLSGQRLARVTQLAQHYIDEQRVSGIVTLITRHGQLVQTEALGQLGLDNDSPMQIDTLFRIYSMTKAMTAVGALILYEQGRFHLDDPVAKFVPELSDMKVYENGTLVNARSPITIHQLFTHMAGLSYGYSPDHPAGELIELVNPGTSASSAEFIEKLARLPLRYHPGDSWQYSFATDVLGVVVERISGLSLGEFLRTRLFDPLGMRDTHFAVPANKRHRLASSHRWDRVSQELKLIAETVPDGALYRVSGFDSGGAGLISTAPDYLRFLEMLRKGGSHGGKRILSPKLVKYMSQDHLPSAITGANIGPDHDRSLGLGGGHGLGIGVYIDPIRRGVLSSRGELDWGGVAGTLFWLDPQEDLIVVAMIQLFSSPWRLRDDLSVATYQALTEINE